MRLSAETVEALRLKGIKLVRANENYRRNSDALQVDLAQMDTETLIKVADVIQNLKPQNNYTKSQLREIEMWLRIVEDPGSMKVGKLHRLPSLLREFLKKKKVFRLYKREHDQSDIWLPYAVTDCTFTPGSRRTGPPMVHLSLAYYTFGGVLRSTTTIAGGVDGKTIEQVLLDRGFVLETKDLYEKWQKDCERYVKLRGTFGFQVIGTGYGMSPGDRWGYGRNRRALTVDGVPSRLVVHTEGKEEEPDAPALTDASFWESQRSEEDEELKQMKFQKKVDALDEDDDVPSPHEDDEEEKTSMLEVPLHAYINTFDLNRHTEVQVHVRATEDYVYDKTLATKLVLPTDVKDLIEMLLDETAGSFKDIVVGKSGGTIVLCSGPPGTGKTLTAEVYSETMERPLYKVQSSQLGTGSGPLEEELKTVLQRAVLWNAILLIDEADVYIHERGDDLEQNAVVGVFLRVLEYFQGVLFLATNRETMVDDAIASRCTAHVRYELPTVEDQVRIWRILAKSTGAPIQDDTIIAIVEKYPSLAGRDVKNLLKLGHLVVKRRKLKHINIETVDFIVRFLSSPNVPRPEELRARLEAARPKK